MQKKINIGFFGDDKWAINSLNLILQNKCYVIKFVCTRSNQFSNNDLKNFCRRKKIACFNFKDINNPSSIKKIIFFETDILISMSYNQIFKKKTIDLIKKKIINCHAGYLPFYRGRSPLNWALINDESFFGITAHYINKGIDKGDIILQKKFKIKDKDNYKTLLEKAHENCPKILIKAISLVLNKKDKPLKQSSIDKKGSYFRKRRNGDERINWNNSAREIFCFVRALCAPSVVATTFFKKNVIKIHSSSSRFIRNKKKAGIGEIIKVTKNYFLVQTSDYVIKITRWNGNVKTGIILS